MAAGGRSYKQKPMNLAVDPRAVESLLAFWADAGVEASYADDPIDRLAEGAAMLRARREPPVPVAVAPVATPAFGRGPDLGAAVAEARALAAACADLPALPAAMPRARVFRAAMQQKTRVYS